MEPSAECAAAIVDDQISDDELQKIKRKYEAQLDRGQPSCLVMFDYAAALIRSPKPDHVRLGLKLLEELCKMDEEDVEKRAYVYFLAIGHTKLKNYDQATKFIKFLLENEPENYQAQCLLALIQKRMRQDGIKGAAIVGGVFMVSGFVGLGVLAGIHALKRR